MSGAGTLGENPTRSLTCGGVSARASTLYPQCFKQQRSGPRATRVQCAAAPQDLGKQAAGWVLGVAAAATLLLPAMPALAVSGGGGESIWPAIRYLDGLLSHAAYLPSSKVA